MKLGLISFLTLALAATVCAQPSIRTSNGILNASGYQPQLAPDTVFVIFGTGLGPAAIQTAAGPNYPTALAGTSVVFAPTTGAPPVTAKMIYTLATQIAGVLPSSITPGTYSVSVTYQAQASPPALITVVPRSLGIATANSAGTGAAQATIGNVNNGISLQRMTGGSISFGGYNWTLSPAHPGDEIVLWGTGGGGDPANDTGGSSGDQTAAGNFTVTVDGTQIVPVYSGASNGYTGLWQVNFVLPSNISADCFAYTTVTGGGVASNGVTIAIAPTGQSSCSGTIPASTLAVLDSGAGNVTLAGLNVGELIYNGATTYSVGGVINRYTVNEFLIPLSGPRIGSCTVLQQTYPAGAKEPSAADLQLDAGTMTISGPGVSAQAVSKIVTPSGPTYSSAVSSVTGGDSYTLSASGGPGVGPFTATLTFPNSFSVTNLSSLSTVNRNQPLTVNWTGSGFNEVKIDINSGVQTSTTNQGVVVNCTVPASPGTYTIPAAALAYLLPSPTVTQLQVIALQNGGGVDTAETTTSPNTVVPLANGTLVNFGGFTAYIDYLLTPKIQ